MPSEAAAQVRLDPGQQSEAIIATSCTSLPRREAAVAAAMALDTVEVLIVGAGINGVGTFRDLALQGVRALIVDREDFGAGASMASSRMAHGGLRYLENGEFRLTAESTRERNRLLRNAPHAVRPLPIAIPFFSWTAGLATALRRALGAKRSLRERGFVMAEIGLLLYDWFGRLDRTMPLHGAALGRRLRTRFPALAPTVVAVSTYYDAVITSPERIALELVDDALKASKGSVALNHCEVVGLEGGAVVLRDRLGDRAFRVRPTVVLNAAGAWIDRINGVLDGSRRLMGGTKGSHLVIDHPGLFDALQGHGMVFDDGRGRVCVVYPMADKVLLGSTDIPVDDPDEAVCTPDEQAYLLEALRIVFPGIAVEARHVLYRFSGVRPLPRSNAATPGAVSRDHSLATFEPTDARPFPVFSLVGGKWTTFRAFSEQVSEAVLARLGRPRRVETERLPIGAGSSYPGTVAAREALIASLARGFGLDRARTGTLIARYGAGAETVAAFLAEGPDCGLPGAPDLSEREVRRLVRCEMAASVEDVIFRRTTLAVEGRLSATLLERVAAIVAEETGIDPGLRDARLATLVARLATQNGVPGLVAPAESAREPVRAS